MYNNQHSLLHCTACKQLAIERASTQTDIHYKHLSTCRHTTTHRMATCIRRQLILLSDTRFSMRKLVFSLSGVCNILQGSCQFIKVAVCLEDDTTGPNIRPQYLHSNMIFFLVILCDYLKSKIALSDTGALFCV